MKRMLLAFVLAFVLVAPAQDAGALSVVYCEEDTVECKIQNCETDVLVQNWPEDTGYTRDCAAEYAAIYTTNDMRKNLFIFGGIAAVAALLIAVKHKRK